MVLENGLLSMDIIRIWCYSVNRMGLLSDKDIDKSIKLRFLTGENSTGGCFGTFYPRDSQNFFKEPRKKEVNKNNKKKRSSYIKNRKRRKDLK